MDYRFCSVLLSIHCRGMSQETLPAESIRCPLFTWQGEKHRSAGAAQSQLRCQCTTCPLAFRYSVFLPMEPLALSYWGIWVLHNPVLEWLLAGHLAGWHRFCAGLTSPCLSGVTSAGCGWCSLPLPSCHQGLAAPFSDSYLSQFAASSQTCSEESLTGMDRICIQNDPGAAQPLLFQPLFPLALFCASGLLQRAKWHVSLYTSFSVVSLPDYVLAGSLWEHL